MTVRPIETVDIEDLKKIHERDYAHEFAFPDFNKHFINTFIIENDDKRIITAGGNRTILESIIITDLHSNMRERKEALSLMLHGSLYFAQKAGYNELHAYVQNEKWYKVLNRVGFKPTKGQSLVAVW